jgi:uncharacterized protein (TIGR02611 family)
MSSLGLKQIRRVVVFVVGMTVLLLGVALIVLPGPAILVIPAGLAILGLEFRWARRWMLKARSMIRSVQAQRFRRKAPLPGADGVKSGFVSGARVATAGVMSPRLDLEKEPVLR